MSTISNRPRPGDGTGPAEPRARRQVVLILAGVALVCVALLVVLAKSGGRKEPAPTADEPGMADTASHDVAERASSLPSTPPPIVRAELPPQAAQATEVKPAPVPVAVVAPAALPAPSAEARALVSGVWQLDPAAGPMTPERAAQWKQNLAQLIQSGAASVPAIAEFLKENRDQYFSAEDGALLGYASARGAMFDALTQMGGAEAIGVLAEALQTTASPREIALLARNLETLAPEQFRPQAVEAARQSLAMAVEKQLEGFDVAPLFEVMQNYGGMEIAHDLKNSASYWNYYSTLALAKLPEGAGVPALIQMATLGEEGKSQPGRLQALQMLAQLAGTSPEARTTLMQQARANEIPANYWPYLARPLSGDEAHVSDSVLNEQLPVLAESSTGASHIKHNNQNFFYAPAGGGLTVEQAQQQIVLVEELGAMTTDPDAQRVLQRTRALLEQRLGKATATAAVEPPPGS